MKLATSDIESNNWIDLVMIGFYDGSEYRIFPNIKTYINFLEREKSGYTIYFHNGGKFDFLFLIEELMERGELNFVEKTGGLLQIKFRNSKCNLTFNDSFALLPSSLERLIEVYGIEEKKIVVDFTKKHKYTDKKLREHLKNDCISLFKILQQTLEKEEYLSLTVASHAMRKFKENFFDGYIWNVNRKQDLQFRKNYYKGGRVEVYKGYGKNLYYYDINSLYPYVMLRKMPCGMPEKTNKFIKGKIGFYKVKLLQDTNFFNSILVIKNREKNYYVNGSKNDIFYLMSNEIEYLLEKKIKLKVIEGEYFESDVELFNQYVSHYYKLKKLACNEVERYIAKMMLNSLYGKFGQKLNGECLEVFNESKHDLKKVKFFDSANDLVLIDRERKVKFKGVYIAAYITSMARLELLRWLDLAGEKNIYYCDTDSIITSKKLPVGREIGELKLEAKIKEGIFLAPKTYGFIDDKGNEIVHYKGFKSNSFSYNDLKDLLLKKKTELSVSKEKMLSFRSAMKRKNGIIKDKGRFLKLVNETKILSLSYDRRKFVESKKYIFETFCYKKNEISS